MLYSQSRISLLLIICILLITLFTIFEFKFDSILAQGACNKNYPGTGSICSSPNGKAARAVNDGRAIFCTDNMGYLFGMVNVCWGGDKCVCWL